MTDLNPYLDLSRIRAALRAMELRPNRALGQSFLTSPAALQQIVDAAELSAEDTAVEVGPGLGVLTWELVRRAGRVVSVELDARLLARLRTEFANATNLTLIEGDILRQDPAALAPAPYKLVANLPYQITSAALRHFLVPANRPSRAVVLVQWEVAERICAQPGDMSVLAHSIQIYAAPRILARVPAKSFEPVPAVDSAVLRLDTYAAPRDAEPELLLRLIKAGHLQARKQLLNALPAGLTSMGQRTDKAAAAAALEAAAIAPDRRAETLSLPEWQRLRAALQR